MRFSMYPEYQETNLERINSIPSHWRLVPCRAIVEECAEKNTDGKSNEYLSLMANIGVIRYEDKGDIGNKKPDDLAKCKVVRAGNLVINSMNYGIGSYGLSTYEGVCSPVYIVLDPIKNVVDTRFALRIFEEKQFQSWAQSFGNGILAHRSAIGWDDLKTIKVALPPLAEQLQLSKFLDHETGKIDALVAEQEKLIGLLKEKRQAVISHTVTKGLDPNARMKDSGVEWLGEVPEGWRTARLKHWADCLDGKRIPLNSEQRAERQGQVPYWGANCIVDFVDEALFDEDLVLLGEDGAPFFDRTKPVAFFSRGPIWPNNHVHILRPKGESDCKFMAYALNATDYADFIDGSTRDKLTQGQMVCIPLPSPPLPEQRTIAAFLDHETGKIDTLIEAAQRAIELMKERRTALISAAVTGKIDVRGYCPAEEEEGA